MIDHVNALVLPVHDVEKCASFYRDALGMEMLSKGEKDAYFRIGPKGGLILALISVEDVAALVTKERIPTATGSRNNSYYSVFVEDVDKEFEMLREKGVSFIKPPVTYPWGQRIAYFEDPEGNMWEISTRPK